MEAYQDATGHPSVITVAQFVDPAMVRMGNAFTRTLPGRADVPAEDVAG
jgi:hypothetical protein